MNNWAVGHNMPGYLPESDVYVTSDWESARDALIWDLERFADNDAEIGDPTEAYDEAITELRKLPAGEEYGTITGNTSFWLNATDEEPEPDEE